MPKNAQWMFITARNITILTHKTTLLKKMIWWIEMMAYAFKIEAIIFLKPKHYVWNWNSTQSTTTQFRIPSVTLISSVIIFRNICQVILIDKAVIFFQYTGYYHFMYTDTLVDEHIHLVDLTWKLSSSINSKYASSLQRSIIAHALWPSTHVNAIPWPHEFWSVQVNKNLEQYSNLVPL